MLHSQNRVNTYQFPFKWGHRNPLTYCTRKLSPCDSDCTPLTRAPREGQGASPSIIRKKQLCNLNDHFGNPFSLCLNMVRYSLEVHCPLPIRYLTRLKPFPTIYNMPILVLPHPLCKDQPSLSALMHSFEITRENDVTSAL